MEIFDLTKVHIRLSESHPYLADVIVAKLRQHPPNHVHIWMGEGLFDEQFLGYY